MTAVLYRAVAALLDLARERPTDRPRAWRALDRLLLTPAEEATLDRCLVDEDDDRRWLEWSAWSSSLLLSKSIAGSDDEPTRTAPPHGDAPRRARRLHLVGSSSQPVGSHKEDA